MSSRRIWLAPIVIAAITGMGAVVAQAYDSGDSAFSRADKAAGGLGDGFEPAVVRAQQGLGRYFVVVDGPAVAQAAPSGTPAAQKAAAAAARSSQGAAIGAAKSAGGNVVFRYDTLVNGFSADLSPNAASALASRPDVTSVEPVSIVQKANESSVPFIGATDVWDDPGVKGQGMKVAVVDDGIDYTHANYGGPGTVEAFESNDPNVIEPGSFPTKKVIGGYDFVGSNYDVLNEDTDDDVPHPDPDPLDECTATYFADYSNYNSSLVGLVVTAGDIGLTNAEPTLAYRVEACSGSFSGDVPGFLCDTAGGTDGGIYTSQLDAADPALSIDPQVCKGFWDGPDCDVGTPISVDEGSVGPDTDPGILALFPNNAPSHDPTIVATDN